MAVMVVKLLSGFEVNYWR